ncbi:putative polyol transporter 6 [Apostasia shenzhenica]|uniref:Putative polyol transporter 6 n=1 Tax=Apostasia shenzhenica TaxID=1088818 RepID=A0A2I0A2P6_9ASPA|nr:putative polyol transporter 6 [Apostasia shenzhenica]
MGKGTRYACSCSFLACMISILLGYDTGVMSGAMIFIKKDLHVSDTQIAVLAGILNVCALLGSLTAGRLSDWIGRRYTISAASAIFFSGSVLMSLAPNYPVLISGRCIAGVGVGYALMIAPVYAAEISSSPHRGFLTSLPELCISSGIFLGYVANWAFSKLPLRYGWRSMLGAAAPPSFLLIFAILVMPESPRWLAMNGRLGDAHKVLGRVSDSGEEAGRRLEAIKSALGIETGGDGEMVKVKEEMAAGKGVWKELLLRPSAAVRKILVAAVGINFLQHVTGVEAIVLYSPRIFEKSGVHDTNKKLLATMGVGLAKILFILVPIFLIDRVGRRLLLLVSLAGMALSLTCVGFGLTMVERTSDDKLPWAAALCVAGVVAFIATYSMGLGPITWVYTSEIFPLRLRAQGTSLCVAVNRLMNSTVSMTFISLYKAITIGGAFFLFAGMAVFAWFFFFLLFPETKGRSLEEMEELFGGRWFHCKDGRREEEEEEEEAEEMAHLKGCC